MLELLLCKDWTSGRDEILNLVAKDVEAKQGRRILLVPELISHDMERRLCAVGGDTVSRYAEVLSFPRLVKRVQEYCGCGAPVCLDEGGRIVAMAAAARQLHSKLKAYAAVETKPEFLKQLVEAVDEFKRSCVTPKDLRWASAQCEGVFAQKLEELSLLMETYDSFCQRGKRDPRDQMNWLLEQLEDSDFGENHVIYIDGFPDFTRQHMAVLEHLIRVSPKVTISLNCDRVGTDNLAMEKAGQTAMQIYRLANAAGISCTQRVVSGNRELLAPIREGLFQGTICVREEARQRLSLYYVDSVYQGCMAAAQEVLSLVRSGCRYRDIGIVCTDMASYGETLNRVMRRCGIPAYQSGKDQVLTNCVITTILSAMRFALSGYDRKDLMQYLKSVLSPVDLDTCDLLENYTYIWSIGGSGWKTPWQFHPRGLGMPMTPEDERHLETLNQAREQVIAPLIRFATDFRSATNMRGQISALYQFLDDITFASRMGDLAKSMELEGDLRSAQILHQLWDILLDALEQLYDVLGETVWEIGGFIRLFTLLLEQYDVGTIPTVLDALSVGQPSAMRCQQVKHLIVLGAEEGKFPGYSGSQGLLSDQERVMLRSLEIPLTGGSLEGLQAEFSEIYGVLCGADETISIFAPQSNPSYVFNRLSKQVKEAQKYPFNPIGNIASEMDAAVYLAKVHGERAARELGIEEAYRHICQQREHDLQSLSPENVRKLYGQRLMLSASQIDSQANCRLAYFLNYGIKAKERKEITVDPAEFGTFVHDVLEHTCRDICQQGGFHNISLNDTLAIARGYAKQYAQERFSEILSQRLEYLFNRNLLELDMIVQELWNELSVSQFEPVAFEVNFGQKDNQMPAVEVDGAAIDACVRGAVDRVDVWKSSGNNYYRVVDYKTGAKAFDYCDVFNGIGLQMLLYLFALEKGENVLGEAPRPVGVQYFPARFPYASAKGKVEGKELAKAVDPQLKRKGLVLKDMDIINAMEPNGVSRLSVKISKNGIGGDVMEREQLPQLKKHVFDTLRSLIADIAGGNITPNPYTRGENHDACKFCPYKKICHYVTVPGRRDYAEMKADRFWEEIRKEQSNG